jgi:hypothetical protein
MAGHYSETEEEFATHSSKEILKVWRTKLVKELSTVSFLFPSGMSRTWRRGSRLICDAVSRCGALLQ